MHNIKQDFVIRDVYFKNFVNLTEVEKHEVLDWRNHEFVSSMMFTKDIISYDEHASFIEKLSIAQDKAYWVAIYKDKKIGVIDLYDITDIRAFWGYYLKSDYIGSAYGILLEYLVLEISFLKFNLKELQCESLSINNSVIKIHKVFGYSIVEVTETCTIQKIDSEIFEKQRGMYELLTKKFWE